MPPTKLPESGNALVFFDITLGGMYQSIRHRGSTFPHVLAGCFGERNLWTGTHRPGPLEVLGATKLFAGLVHVCICRERRVFARFRLTGWALSSTNELGCLRPEVSGVLELSPRPQRCYRRRSNMTAQ
ncbi:hypothetical protein BDP81DRAFT_436992 [Colletotrichum phormii]|uniref:Uncharacterized protein n=1 Tax=Colletotrichum phormii TaxID=359342 RepID=A0AAI9ZIC5_9PEZI|nr:uncharacterized protein BDP81DRAFT_436992 [Colletotrichum phormii]KAK1625031.1 hypothetical protein BDP81DRAFT_436992 [Colletotrichum phormii]